MFTSRARELLVGLRAVRVLEVSAALSLKPRLVVMVESIIDDRTCSRCGLGAWVNDRPVVDLVHLTCFGRPVTLQVGRIGRAVSDVAG